MTDRNTDEQRKREECQTPLAEVRRIAAEMQMAHTMSDEDSYEALLILDLESAFGDDDNKKLGDV
jgi:hypothetical protein